MTDCLFCKISKGETDTEFLYEDDQLVVFPDLYPKAKIHLLVVPKIHIASVSELTSDNEGIMGYTVCTLPKIAKEQNLNFFRTIINNGRESGQQIFHIHFHMLSGPSLPGF